MAIFQMLTCLSENLPVILKYMYGAYNYVQEKEQQPSSSTTKGPFKKYISRLKGEGGGQMGCDSVTGEGREFCNMLCHACEIFLQHLLS